MKMWLLNYLIFLQNYYKNYLLTGLFAAPGKFQEASVMMEKVELSVSLPL